MKTKHGLEQKLTTIQTKIATFQKQKQEIDQLMAIYPQLTKDYNMYQKNLTQLEQYQQLNTQVKLQQKSFQKQTKTIQENTAILETLQSKIKKIPTLRLIVDRVDSHQQQLTTIEKRISVLQTQQTEYTQNKTSSKDGMCPFLGTQCKNIEGESLSTYFEQKLEANRQELKKVHNERKTIEKHLLQGRLAQKEIEKLMILEAQVHQKLELNTQLSQENAKIQKFLDTHPDITTQLISLQNQQKKLKTTADQYLIVHDKITKELPGLEKKIIVMEDNTTPIIKKLTPIKNYLQKNQHIQEELTKIRTLLKATQIHYETYQKNLQLSKKVPNILKALHQVELKITTNEKQSNQTQTLFSAVMKKFDSQNYTTLEQKQEALNHQIITLKQDIINRTQQQKEVEKEYQALLTIAKQLTNRLKQFEQLEDTLAFTQTLRDWFKEAGPKITGALLNNINRLASELYRDLMGTDNVKLVWQEDFDVLIISSQNEKVFSQLSGGEQMAVALALRLAILRILTSIDFAFFDEPTTNLDPLKRQNLAKCSQNIHGFVNLFNFGKIEEIF